jgi:hypothetical protein
MNVPSLVVACPEGGGMPSWRRLFRRLMEGSGDFAPDELLLVAARLGCDIRQGGKASHIVISHELLRRPGRPVPRIVIVTGRKRAKQYEIARMREFISPVEEARFMQEAEEGEFH